MTNARHLKVSHPQINRNTLVFLRKLNSMLNTLWQGDRDIKLNYTSLGQVKNTDMKRLRSEEAEIKTVIEIEIVSFIEFVVFASSGFIQLGSSKTSY